MIGHLSFRSMLVMISEERRADCPLFVYLVKVTVVSSFESLAVLWHLGCAAVPRDRFGNSLAKIGFPSVSHGNFSEILGYP